AAALGLVHPGGAVPGHLHLGARRRAGARRDPVAAARAAPGGHRDGADGSADLPLRHPAAELPHHPAASHLGVHEHHQELLGRADHRAARAHRARARDAGVQLPGVRGVHGGDRDLPAHQSGGGAAHARRREKAARARPDRGRRHAAGGALMSGFDFDVIERSLPYLFREGMTFTLTLTAPAMTGGIVFGTLLPVLLTQTIILFQDTSLVYVISATDFLGAASKIANRDYRLVEMYSFVAIVYFAMSYGLSTLVRRLQQRIAIIR